jgi:hypothetical protein
VIEDHMIRQMKIGGQFQSTDPEGFVAALRPMGVRRVEPDAASAPGDHIRLIGIRGL